MTSGSASPSRELAEWFRWFVTIALTIIGLIYGQAGDKPADPRPLPSALPQVKTSPPLKSPSKPREPCKQRRPVARARCANCH